MSAETVVRGWANAQGFVVMGELDGWDVLDTTDPQNPRVVVRVHHEPYPVMVWDIHGDSMPQAADDAQLAVLLAGYA